VRSLDDLLEEGDAMIQRIRQWIESAVVQCTLLPPSPQRGDVLQRIQKPTSTVIGALAYETGGLLLDHGWLRFLGSGNPQLTRDLASWNASRSKGFCMVADDAVGGFFAVNEGAWEGEAGGVFYWAPDNLEWESIGFGYEEFLEWCLTPYFADFYQNLRWSTWKDDVRELNGDSCFAFDPLLWTKQGSLKKSRRRIVPVDEAFRLKVNYGSSKS
jgi:hypothetical protein